MSPLDCARPAREATARGEASPVSDRLGENEVTHLALEGGGGKGIALLGAIRALDELKILSKVQGFAGSSAGAITAMLLACGLDYQRIRCWMARTDFTKFFDPVSREQVVWSSYSPSVLIAKDPKKYREEVALRVLFRTWIEEFLLQREIVRAFAEPSAPIGREDRISRFFRGKNPPPQSVLGPNMPSFLAYLWRDLGLFSGVAALKEFDRVTRQLVRGSADSPSAGPVTFAEHYGKFKKELVVTGSNLKNGKTVFFSCSRTPQVPLCIAVRISMSLPFIYKPVLLDDADEEIAGLYVDGGVWNNTPASVFDAGKSRATTFVLRLGVDAAERSMPVNFGEFLLRYLALTVAGSGETQFGPPQAYQAQELQVTGLDLVSFSPPPVGRDRAIRRAYEDTMGYFSELPRSWSYKEDGLSNSPPEVKDDAAGYPDLLGLGCPH